MQVRCIILILLFPCLTLQAQKTEIINPSGFTHDYVVSKLNYIEDLKDTTRLKYISDLSLKGIYDNELGIIQWFDLVKIKAKSLGANSFYVLNYSETETSAYLLVKLFFAGESFFKTNKKKRVSNPAFIFNQNKFAGDSVNFYLDQKKVLFFPAKYYELPILPGQKYTISVNKAPVTSKRILFKKEKESRFFILPQEKASVIIAKPLMVTAALSAAFVIKANSFHELDCTTGRFLLEIYK
jgi:hypothetical protein